jgi:hypothetical protein
MNNKRVISALLIPHNPLLSLEHISILLMIHPSDYIILNSHPNRNSHLYVSYMVMAKVQMIT